jgi:uncharacterized membrane protein YraQ (UPF0718 family)
MPPALTLLLSVVMLAAGPLLLWRARRVPGALQLLDGFVLVAVGGLVLADVIPHAVEQGGWLALPLVLVGLLGPAMLEKGLHRAASQVHFAALLLGLSGLALHAMLDGVALSGFAGGAQADRQLALAVLLHRLPEGLTLWWLLRPVYGRMVAGGALLAVAVVTAVGMMAPLGVGSHGWLGGQGLALVQALVGGSLLHVVVHRPHPLSQEPVVGVRRHASGVGGLLGAALLAVVLSVHHHGEGPEHADLMHGDFWLLARESAPALLLAYVCAGLVQVLLPSASVAWMSRGGPFGQALRGALFGLPLPICSCGVVPVYRSLALQGVPPAAALAFLVATPELGLDAVLLSVPLLGWHLAVLRVLAAASVALGVGWILGHMLGNQAQVPHGMTPSVDTLAHKTHRSLPNRVLEGLRVGLGEMVDHTGPWVLLGLVVAALAAPVLSQGALASLPRGWDVPLLALAGMPVYVCASGATPLVAVLIAGGVSPGAGLAFLLTGPATNLTTFGILERIHGSRLALAFAGLMGTLAIAMGFGVNAILGSYHVPPLALGTEHEHGGLADAALVVLGALLAVSLLRQGPRAFLGQILGFANGEREAHDHGHAHGHGHGHDHHHGHDHDHDH